ncbi:MAG: hypothetical protein IKP77_05425 [Acholeplasmatales bacterium]|nr:hypothetical protein [Acholeplasmatales bacterium]
MSSVKVEFRINTKSTNEVYIVGSVPQLGSWDVKKAIKLEKNDAGIFTVSKLLATGQLVEFKVLADKDWARVEKGVYNEEIQNHIIAPEKGLIVELDVARFNK